MEDVEKWKTIVIELVVKAPDKMIKYCLCVYDPNEPSKQNVINLKKCQKEPLKKQLIFLVVKQVLFEKMS